MKQLLSLLVATILVTGYSCQTKTDAQNAETGAASETENGNEKDSNNDGAFLKAVIDGKKWSASKMGPTYGPGSDYKLVNGETSSINISFQLHKPYSGMKRQFDDSFMANFITDDGFFSGKSGEVIVTSADDKWIEGSFFFTANSTSSAKSYQVKDGTFRVPAN